MGTKYRCRVPDVRCVLRRCGPPSTPSVDARARYGFGEAGDRDYQPVRDTTELMNLKPPKSA